jgi:hypothetical protein
MRRISHDLPGVSQRIAKLRDNLGEAARETELEWRDEKGAQFFQQHISHVGPALSGLVSSLAVAIEQFEDIAKKVQDPDAA